MIAGKWHCFAFVLLFFVQISPDSSYLTSYPCHVHNYICVGVFLLRTNGKTTMQLLTIQTDRLQPSAIVTVHTSITARLLLSTFRTALALSLSAWQKFSLMLMGDTVSSTHFCKRREESSAYSLRNFQKAQKTICDFFFFFLFGLIVKQNY